MGGIKRTPADAAFSNCVRERANWTCEVCGSDFNGRNTGGLDCSHFITRSHKSIRYDPINAMAHCTGCHSRIGGDPPRFNEHYLEVFGQESLDLVRQRQWDNDRGRRAHRERPQIAAHYRKEFEKMREKRMAGIQGRLEFTDYFELDVDNPE